MNNGSTQVGKIVMIKIGVRTHRGHLTFLGRAPTQFSFPLQYNSDGEGKQSSLIFTSSLVEPNPKHEKRESGLPCILNWC